MPINKTDFISLAASFYDEDGSSYPDLLQEAAIFLAARRPYRKPAVPILVVDDYDHRLAAAKRLEHQLARSQPDFSLSTTAFAALLTIPRAMLDDMAKTYCEDPKASTRSNGHIVICRALDEIGACTKHCTWRPSLHTLLLSFHPMIPVRTWPPYLTLVN